MKDNARDAVMVLLVVLLFAAGLAVGVWWTFYKFNDCRRVGHTLTYCIADQVFG